MYCFLGVARTARTTWSRTLPRAPGISGSLKTAPTGGLYFGAFFSSAADAALAAEVAAGLVCGDVEAPAEAENADTASSGASRAIATVAGTTRTERIE